jgi:hypothetical protein
MFQDAGRLRLLWSTFACATLAACGGGGGGAGSGAAPPSSPPTSESAYLLAEFAAADSNNQSVRVWDPAHPATAVQNVRLTMSNGIVWTSSHLVFSDATQYDATTRTVTTLGHAKVFYDNDGKLYSIDLRGGHSHAPVQLSSAVDVFLPRSAVAMNAAGDDAWVDAQGGSNDWAIRSTMVSSSAPITVRRIEAPLRDVATGLPQYLFASVAVLVGTAPGPTTFEVVDPSFTPVPNSTVAAMSAGDAWIGTDPAHAGTGYLLIANHLRTLRWSAGAVSVDAGPGHDLGSSFLTLAVVSDARSLYIADGGTVLSVSGGDVGTVGSLSTGLATLVDAGDYIAAYEIANSSSAQTFHQIEALRKSDGLLTRVEPPAAALQLLGASSQGLVISGSAEQPQAFVVASGDNSVRTTVGAQAAGIVVSATAPLDRPAPPVGLLSCVAGTTGFCVPGPLTQFDFNGGSTTLGTLSASAPQVNGVAVAGLANALAGQTFLASPGGFGKGQTDVRDAWQFTPGLAASLTRVTANLP